MSQIYQYGTKVWCFWHWPSFFRIYHGKISRLFKKIESNKNSVTQLLDEIAADQSEIERMRKERRFCEICDLTVYSDNMWQIHLNASGFVWFWVEVHSMYQLFILGHYLHWQGLKNKNIHACFIPQMKWIHMRLSQKFLLTY